MGIIEALDTNSSEAASKGKEYIKLTKEYYELKVFQQLAIVFSIGCKALIYGILSTLGLIFLAITSAVSLNAYFEDASIGYFIVGLSFFGLIALTFLIRKRIEKFIILKLSKNYFD
jgi:hypothetical protein